MSAFKFLSKSLSAIVVCFLFGGVLFADSRLLVTNESDRLYGKGVHAFFDRNYEEAVAILSRVGEMGIEDPRPYYFLGLALLRQNKTEQAEQFFRIAAQLEHSGRALRNYSVSESLRRIQGEERMRIEDIRTEERANARTRDERLQAARYGSDTADAREALLRTLQPASRVSSPAENLAALQAAEGFGDNAFGVRPVNPIVAQEESITIQRGTVIPFGGVATGAVENEPEGSVAAEPDWLRLFAEAEAVAAAEAAREERVRAAARDAAARAAAGEPEGLTFRVGFDPTMVDVENILFAPIMLLSPQGMVGTMVNAPPEIQTEAARQAGRALGTWFSRSGGSD